MFRSGKIRTGMSSSLGITTIILNYVIYLRSNTVKDIHQESEAATRFGHIKKNLKKKGMMNSTVNLLLAAAIRSDNWLYNKIMELLKDTKRSTR